MPLHHVPAEVLVAYAAGTGSAGEDLLVACHLTYCPACRAAVDRAEAIGATVLDRAPSAPLPAGAWDGLLAALDAPPHDGPPVHAQPQAQAQGARCPVFPSALRDRVGPLDAVAWAAVGAGLRAAKVGDDDRVFLLDFPPGFRIPHHGHHGTERALVLRGGFSDERAVFERGDVSWRDDPGHDVRIHDDGRCTTLFVNDGPADYGVFTPLVDWWVTPRAPRRR
ncbi:MAG: ChrR family anti-sigma-E factor [Myxococcota bacterium]